MGGWVDKLVDWMTYYTDNLTDRKCFKFYILKIYIKDYFWKYPNIPKFIQLLTSDKKELNINIAMFIQKSFELRKTYLTVSIIKSELLRIYM